MDSLSSCQEGSKTLDFPQTLVGVLDALDDIININREHRSRLGYFPALYRAVTREVQRRCETNYFDQPDRMRSLTVNFANRYLRAYRAHQRGDETVRPWTVAFDAATRWRPIVLQHLLLGMNAHINYDLSLATLETVSREDLDSLASDFHRITQLLGEQIDQVQDRLSRVWFSVRFLDWMGQRMDETLINFSLEKARDHAWSVVRELAELEGAAWSRRVEKMEARTGVIARLILNPGITLSSVNLMVRLGEPTSVTEVISVLAD